MGSGWFIAVVIGWMVISVLRRVARELPRGGSGDLTPPRSSTEASRTVAEVLREIQRMSREAGKGESMRRPSPIGAATRIGKPTRAARPVVDYDEQAAAVAQARIDRAEARDAPLDEATHQAFDKQIRQDSAEAAPSAKPRIQQLRDAFVWSEILGPPGGLQ
jgi:hypothetical protein